MSSGRGNRLKSVLLTMWGYLSGSGTLISVSLIFRNWRYEIIHANTCMGEMSCYGITPVSCIDS